MDGGDVELVGVEGGVAKVRLLGACGGCPMAMMTLVGFVEERLKQRVPQIQQVVNV
jgi:Fe-S cluster biogenesis protein NfuA